MKLALPHQHLAWQVARLPCANRSRPAFRPISCATTPSITTAATATSPPVPTAASDLPGTLSDEDVQLFKELHPMLQRAQPDVGAFQKLPIVMTAEHIAASAYKKAKQEQPSKNISNIAKRERNRGAKQLDCMMKELTVPLTTYYKKFPRTYELHAYERSLLEFTLGKEKYNETLNNVNVLRKRLTDTGKHLASQCAKATRKQEALDRKVEGIQELLNIFNDHAHYVEELKDTAKILRRLPVVNIHVPILCLVGAPNVGKSSLVRVLSTGKPEVCDYPFTTRAISMGHIKHNFDSFQVTDTPGLLNRTDAERNDIEKLTLAALAYLPTGVLYVHDLTGGCGTSVDDQFQIYKEIRSRFPNRPWINAVSKADLFKLQDDSFDSQVDELTRYKAFGPPGALRVSTETLENIEELKSRVLQLLLDLAPKVKRREDGDSSEDEAAAAAS